MLLQAGKTIKEIVKFAELDSRAVTKVARKLDLEPTSEVQRRGKELYASPQGMTFQEIAKTLAGQGFTADDGAPMHHLTVASWVKNYGWAWGGAVCPNMMACGCRVCGVDRMTGSRCCKRWDNCTRMAWMSTGPALMVITVAAKCHCPPILSSDSAIGLPLRQVVRTMRIRMTGNCSRAGGMSLP